MPELPLSPARQSLLGSFRRFARAEPAAAATAADFIQLLGDAANPFVRERREGHFTASSWLVSGDGRRVLLTHHRKLGRWLQLGGHADGEEDLAQVALKEAEEESGLSGLRVESAIFDLDRHWIPEYKGVPGHWHHDVRFVVHAEGGEAFVVSEESLALAWRDIDGLAEDARADESLRRMARRWLADAA
ncbi:NUDIX domain-containing protein [Lysobacter pythonis]|uniref:NUDIX domain-containing protein n=1 Tax=Solilutibacter pythonis TaxID=2483112 RepID=A0A3M2HM17_9GAMM|nr:NUDIX hydrolase [Lysobacter pythonis]RMH90766.1 NUDIX domain-containing protein [Lysobacter pythonis]